MDGSTKMTAVVYKRVCGASEREPLVSRLLRKYKVGAHGFFRGPSSRALLVDRTAELGSGSEGF
jgi:hypothetical protein